MDSLEKRVFSVLEGDEGLWTGGDILTNTIGGLKGIVADSHSSSCAGLLQYSYFHHGNSLDIGYLSNNCKLNCDLQRYRSDKARRRGLLTLLDTFGCIAEMVGATKLTINTWILSARPNLLADPQSFFYGWKPVSKKSHQDAVKANSGIKHLRDQESFGDLVQYYKKVKINKEKRKFKVPKYGSANPT